MESPQVRHAISKHPAPALQVARNAVGKMSQAAQQLCKTHRLLMRPAAPL